MDNALKDEYKIQSFDTETQSLLKTALKEPSTVDLEKVSNVIIDQSLKDPVFSKEAGRICYTIVQAEAKLNNGNVFRRNLLNRLQQEFNVREETRCRSIQEWVCYVTFICNIFDYLKVNNMPMMALVHPVYDCLFRLTQSDALQNEEEVDCLAEQVSNGLWCSCGPSVRWTTWQSRFLMVPGVPAAIPSGELPGGAGF
ncbi:MIF4G domain-containing protein B-like isoform X2 [Brienomyrus brachyistius]|uniref:MIF4G domain-containing protein B-like isoform X2 n=1 Tax=Brienomyrus brachyistius TaxID=42636 RepID=UPI0020B2DD68|nr:MIF4G domain-containing protein B-like isoform X2 [Brienomyrus brachyistius]